MKISKINNRLIYSLFDYSETWAKPYIKAGYAVMLWDKQKEGDLITHWCQAIENIEEAAAFGYIPYGLLAAPPCTAFAASGAQWWPIKDKPLIGSNGWPVERTDRYGRPKFNLKHHDCELEEAVTLVQATLLLRDELDRIAQQYGRRLQFWALENPRGRIEQCVPELAPHRKMVFNPCEFGDPYTKETYLWGEFNTALPKAPVAPVEGSKMHSLPGNKDRARKRSTTPQGFANAFFQANQ